MEKYTSSSEINLNLVACHENGTKMSWFSKHVSRQFLTNLRLIIDTLLCLSLNT